MELRERAKQCVRHSKLYKEQACRWLASNWATATRMAILLAVMVVAYGTRRQPTELPVQQVLLIVQTFGLFFILAVPVIRVFSRLGDMVDGLIGTMGRAVWSLTGYAVALWVIGEFGDEVYRWSSADPREAVVVVIALVICWIISRLGSAPAAPSPVAFDYPPGGVAALAPFRRKATARDSRYIAAHEAGHALVYAALGTLPPNVKLTVHEQPDANGALGFITGIEHPHRLEEKEFVEWFMLVLLAGKLAESRLQGSSTMGSSNDHMRWVAAARGYLANHYRGMFYLEPQNKFEQEANEAKLEALQAEQLAMLSMLFDLNAEVYQKLAETLLERRVLARDELTPILGSPRFQCNK